MPQMPDWFARYELLKAHEAMEEGSEFEWLDKDERAELTQLEARFQQWKNDEVQKAAASAQKLDNAVKGKTKGQSAQSWLDSLPQGTKPKIKDWLNSDLGARQEKQFKKPPTGLKELNGLQLPDEGVSPEEFDKTRTAHGTYGVQSDDSPIEKMRGMRYIPNPKGPNHPAYPIRQNDPTYNLQGADPERQEDVFGMRPEGWSPKGPPPPPPPKPPRENPFGPDPEDAYGFHDPAKQRKEQHAGQRERHNYEYQRNKDEKVADSLKAERVAKELEEQAKQQQEAEKARSKAAKELADANKLWWVSLENVGDEILNTASEAPISPGGGAASGSNLGRLFRRLKSAPSRFFNAAKGRRFGKKQLTHLRGVGGKGGAAKGAGKAAAAARGGAAARGAAAGAKAGPWGAVAGAAAGAVGGSGGKGGASPPGNNAGGQPAPSGPSGGTGGIEVSGAAIVAFTAGVTLAGKAVYDFARAQEDVVRKLADVGAQQAAGVAILDAKRIGRDIKTAQETGGSSQALTESLSRFEDALQPLEALITNIANTLGAELLEKMSNFLENMQPIIEAATAVYKWVTGDDIDKMNSSPETAWDFIKSLEAEQEKSRAPMWPQGPTGTAPGAGSYSAQGYVSNRYKG